MQVLRSSGYKRVIDMSGHERRDQTYFEGTGEGVGCTALGGVCASGATLFLAHDLAGPPGAARLCLWRARS